MIEFFILLLSKYLFSQTQLITKNFDWKIYSTRHFDVYHTTESTRWLGYLEKYLENAYEKGKREYNPNLTKRIPFFFYSASKYFQQNTITEVGEGTGGFTEPYKDRFVVYSDGSKRWLKYVIYHEFGHEIQFSILVDGWWESPRILKTIFYPMWMIEGLSENMTDDWDIALEDMYVRDYFLDGKLPSLDKLFGFGHLKPHQVTLGYKTGAKAIRFLKEEYGYDKPGLMLYLWRDSYDINTVLQKLIGIDIYKFDSKFKEYLSIRYLKQIKELNLIDASNYGMLITSNKDDIPVFNVSPVVFGSTIAYISTITGYPSVIIEDRNTKKRIILDRNKTKLDYIPYSKFTLPVRYLSISGDGNYLFFTGRKNHRDFICIYEMGTGKLRKIPVNGVDEIGQINVSTDLKKIVFSAMKNSVYDIYEAEFDLVLNSNEFNINSAKQLTDDDDYDSTPQYITNDEVVFICEEEKDDIIKNSICSVKNGKKYKIFDLVDVSDYYYDKKNFIFYIVSSSSGVYDLYSYHTDGRFFKNTSVIGGVFTPYVSGEKIYFSYFRHGSIHIYESEYILLNYKKIEGENILNSKDFEQSEFKVDSFKVYDYKLKFSTDLFFPAFLYSSSGGMYIFNYFQLSDYTSRHSISLFTNYNSGYSYLDLRLSYLYNRYRTKLIFSGNILNYTDDYTSLEYKREIFTSDFGLIYPLDIYSQIYFSFNLKNNFKDYKDFNPNFTDLKERKRGISISYLSNKLEGLYLTAISGYVVNLSLSFYNEIFKGNRRYENFIANYIKYFPLSRKSTFVNRFLAGFSSGRDYVIYSYSGVGGVRGIISSYAKAKNVVLYNAELRLPLTYMDYYLDIIVPDFYFKSLYIKVFTDNSYDWCNNFNNGRYLNSFGFGFELYTFILQNWRMVISLDFSKNTKNGSYISYFYLGPVF